MRGVSAPGFLALWAIVSIPTGCGKKEPARPEEDTPEYRAWKGSQLLRQLPFAAGVPTVPGRLEILSSGERVRRAGDFCEVYLNGEILLRYKTARLPDGLWPRWEGDLRLRVGPNWIDLWDSTTNRNYREQVDSRVGTDLQFTPTAEGYEFRQTKTE
jgi:hypothetical protein